MIGLMLIVYVPGQVRTVSGQTVSFSSPQILQSIAGANDYPATLQSSNGSLWVAWQHYQYQALFRTFNGISWSPVQTLPTGGTRFNISPSMVQFNNGTIMFLWSSNQTGYWNIYYETLTGNVWSKAVQLTSGPFNDFFPQATVATGSVLWLFWERVATGSQQIYYKILTGSSWSADNQFTFDPTLNVTPSIIATKDGKVWVSWSKLDPKTGNYFVWSRVYNGTGWSADNQLTNAATWDLEPSLAQDRNGTLWLFWSRQMQLTTGINPIFQQKLFYKFSVSLGQTWSGENQLTFSGDATTPIDDLAPSAVQGSTKNLNGTIDRGLWIFFSSDLTGQGANFDIYYIRSSQIYPVHDIAVTSVQASPARMFPWGIRQLNIAKATISVIVTDVGDFPENVLLTVQVVNATSFNLGSVPFTISSGLSRVIAFSWNASLASPGIYTIIASAAPLPGESAGNIGGNTLSAKALSIVYPGDLDLSGKVTILDASLFGVSWQTTPGSPNWNPDADIVYNGMVDILDASVFGANWQKSI